MSAEKPIKVQVRDPDTDELLGERTIDNDYMVICAGECYVSNTQVHGNGSHVVTIKGRH